jgi:hypothetical protein
VSAPVPVFPCRRDGDRVRLRDGVAGRLRDYIRTLPVDGELELTVRVRRKRRSLDQNAWIWGVAYPLLGEGLGYDRHEIDDMHYALVAKCFGTHVDDRLGTEVPNVRSSKLTTKEFSEYMDWLVRFAAGYGVVIPLPDEAEAA